MRCQVPGENSPWWRTLHGTTQQNLFSRPSSAGAVSSRAQGKSKSIEKAGANLAAVPRGWSASRADSGLSISRLLGTRPGECHYNADDTEVKDVGTRDEGAFAPDLSLANLPLALDWESGNSPFGLVFPGRSRMGGGQQSGLTLHAPRTLPPVDVRLLFPGCCSAARSFNHS